MSLGPVVWVVALGLLSPLVYFPLKKGLAARSLEKFLVGWTPAAAPVANVAIPSGGEFVCRDAYARSIGPRQIMAVFGPWSRGTVMVRGAAVPVVQRIGGYFVPAATKPPAVASPPLLAMTVAGGTLLLWPGLPSSASMRSHLEEVERWLAQAA
jgi:hypothetical protein